MFFNIFSTENPTQTFDIEDSRPNFGACARLSVSGEVPVLRMARRVRVCKLSALKSKKVDEKVVFSIFSHFFRWFSRSGAAPTKIHAPPLQSERSQVLL